MAKRPKRVGPTMLQRSRAIPPSEKASYALGEGRVDRDFFGLSPSDEDAIYERVALVLDAQLESGHAQ